MIYLDSLLLAFLIASTILILFKSNPYQNLLQRLKLPKPFSCLECLTLWTGLLLLLLQFQHPPLLALLGAGTSVLVSDILDQWYKRL